ncbi:hypothetical protein D3C72_1989840 [compost metagenome]
MYSGPLSQRMAAGLPRHAITCSNTRLTRKAGSEKSTSIHNASRLKSSITLNNRTERPSLSWSCIKSIDQQVLGFSGTANAAGFARTSRFLGFIRKLSSSSR